VETIESESIAIEPLANLPVMKDLVVDLGPFFAKWKKVHPALHPRNNDSKELAIVRPDSEFGRQAQVKTDCITCGACYSVCGIAGSNADYLGPAAINKAMLRLLDPRDGNVADRLEVLNDETGVWRCHTQFNCVAACPKGINLTDSIMKMKRSLLFPNKFYNKQSAT
jgi:succinate dehydrogenase/fumarate reductase iron-sulfur protein